MTTQPAASRPLLLRAPMRGRAVAMALGGLRFAGMALVGMLAVWALVLIFG